MNSYLLFKSLHLIAVISWMAGLLYLPRIFVYHVENIHHKISSSIFKTMERKLFYFIMMPAMVLSWVFGLILISVIGYFNTLVKTKININNFINNLSFLFRKIT
jgi:putative membrane protein